MKRILEEIIERNTEGNYLLSSSDKSQMISEILDLLGVSGSALDIVKQIPQVPQTQMALNDQLKILRIAANKLGLYDAADFIRCD